MQTKDDIEAIDKEIKELEEEIQLLKNKRYEIICNERKNEPRLPAVSPSYLGNRRKRGKE